MRPLKNNNQINAAAALLVFVCGWYAPAALEEKKGFFLLESKERDSRYIDDFPAHRRGVAIHFFLDEKVNKKSPLRLML